MRKANLCVKMRISLLSFGIFAILLIDGCRAAKLFKSLGKMASNASKKLAPMMQKATATLNKTAGKMQQNFDKLTAGAEATGMMDQQPQQQEYQEPPPLPPRPNAYQQPPPLPPRPYQSAYQQQSNMQQQTYQEQPNAQQHTFQQQPYYISQPPNQLMPKGPGVNRVYNAQPGINPNAYYKEHYRNEYMDRLEGFLRKVGIKPRAVMSRKDRKRLQRIKEELCYDDDEDESREERLDEETDEDLRLRRKVKGYKLVPVYR